LPRFGGALLWEAVAMEQGIPPWVSEIRERLARIEERLDNFHDVRKAAFGAKETAEDAMEVVKELQADRNKFFWAIIGTWIAAAADFLFRRQGG